MEVVTTVVVYSVALLAAALVACGSSPRGAIVVLLSGLILTPYGFVTSPPGVAPSYLEVFLLIGGGSLVLRELAEGRSLPVPYVITALMAYYVLRLLADLALVNLSWFAYLRDFRPVASLAAVVVVGLLLRRAGTYFRPRSIMAMLAIAILVDTITYFAGDNFGVSPVGIAGEFYSRTGVLRYSDALSVCIFGFLNYMFFLDRRTYARSIIIILMLVLVALSLNRVFAIFLILNIGILTYSAARSRTNSRAVVGMVLLACFVIISAAGFVIWRNFFETEGEVLSRWLEIISLEKLFGALLSRFMSPAVEGGYRLTASTFLFGSGQSFLFYIPWFDYRGLDPYHASVDSFFFASFVKYGIVGTVLLTASMSVCLWRMPNPLAHGWFWAYMVVHNGIAVPEVLLFLLLSTAMKPNRLLIVRTAGLSIPRLWAVLVQGGTGEAVPFRHRLS